MRAERLRRALHAIEQLDAVEKVLLLQKLHMEIVLRELEVLPMPATSEPRAVIAAPARSVHPTAAAAPSLRVVRGGGRQPSDNWAAVPGTWRSDA